MFFGLRFESGAVAPGTEQWVHHAARVLRRSGRDVRVVASGSVFGTWVDVEDVNLPPVHTARTYVRMNAVRGDTQPASVGKEPT